MDGTGRPKLTRVTRIDGVPAGRASFDEQGFMHDTPVVTSTGIFEYALPDGGVRRELRLPEHVFDKESLASYQGKPVIITHDAGSIDKDNVMEEIVGTVLSEGFQDGSDVRCKIVIHDIDKVRKMPYRELSLGYSLDLVEEPGEWEGEPYDAIQTNIRINHLAIVENARAGGQAHLNLDGKKAGDDDKKQEGGKRGMDVNGTRLDGLEMTPEELVEAINQYKTGKEAGGDTNAAGEGGGSAIPGGKEEAGNAATPAGEPAAEPPAHEAKKEDGDVGKLIGIVEGFLAELKAAAGGGTEAADGCSGSDECSGNEDGCGDKSGSMNNDSADDIFRQRLSICRMGDRLNMDGLEGKSIMDGKKAIIAKVFPEMRLDGKAKEYVDAAYDLAVGEACGRKGVEYQKRQMSSSKGQQRADGNSGSNAAAARQRMIEREGGNE